MPTLLNLKKKPIPSNLNEKFHFFAFKNALKNKIIRKVLIRHLERRALKNIKESKKQLLEVMMKKYWWVRAVAFRVLKNYEKGYISDKIIEKLLEVMVQNNFGADKVSELVKVKEEFYRKYGEYPPTFIVVSPTQVCNLRCKGCYAASSPGTGATLPFDIFDRILRENHDIFGSRFVTISGGEPLMYQSQGRTLLDIFEKYNDTFFIFYTNGTLITKEVAERLAKIGNAIPQISAEGLKEETDKRRGKGVFQRILKSMAYLREAGAPFVLSVTSTSENVDTLLSDEFYNFWFDKQGASYMWQFQLMPIGRGKEVFNLMPGPKERLKLYRKWEEMLKKDYPVADFWNSGVLSNGCIAYGRENGGYFYIDWNGNITPCVFIPYYVDNVYELYKKGKTIADALFSEFFKKGREWQRKYGYANWRKPENWLMPCSIRDNYQYFKENILSDEVKAEDKFAEEARNSEEYYKKLIEYDKELKELTQPIWDEEYINDPRK